MVALIVVHFIMLIVLVRVCIGAVYVILFCWWWLLLCFGFDFWLCVVTVIWLRLCGRVLLGCLRWLGGCID